MSVITRPALAPPLRMAWLLLLIGLLTAALVASVAIVGSRFLTSTGPESNLAATALIPRGDDAVFAFSGYDSGPIAEGEIHTVRADGSDLRQLTDGPGIRSHPKWSPDGTRISFHHWQDGSDSIVVMDAGGGNQTTLATNTYATEDCLDRRGLAWAPDGTSLIFATREDGCTGAYDLSIVAADGSSPPTRLLAPGLNSLHASWSPDGTRLAYLGSEGSGDVGLYVVDTSPGDALSGDLEGRLIAPDLGPGLANVTFGYEYSQPRWSPDGTEVVVGGPTTGDFMQTGIFIVKADGSGQRLAIEDAGNPAWSPDGQQLAFHRTVDPSEWWNSRPCTVRTWVIDADGHDERQLEELGDGCDGNRPLWSPDGTRLATMLIASTPDDPALTWRLGFVMVDGSRPPVLLGDTRGSWQPVAAPLPPAPSFAPASQTP